MSQSATGSELDARSPFILNLGSNLLTIGGGGSTYSVRDTSLLECYLWSSVIRSPEKQLTAPGLRSKRECGACHCYSRLLPSIVQTRLERSCMDTCLPDLLMSYLPLASPFSVDMATGTEWVPGGLCAKAVSARWLRKRAAARSLNCSGSGQAPLIGANLKATLSSA